MHKTFRRSLLSLAVLQAIGTGMAAPGTALANESEQPSATAAFAQTRDLRRELIELKNAVIESPEDASLRFELGKLYLRIGDAASAEKELRRAQDLGLDDYELLLTLGEVWIAQGDFRRVITDDALLDTQDAEQRAALKTLQGQALLVQGRTDEARDHFAEALIQVEDYGPAWLAMAESHLTDDDVVAAQQAMSRARTAADLDAAELLRVEGNIAIALERFEEAIGYYRQALEHRRGDPVLLRGLAVSQLRADQPEQASETLDRLLAQNPNNTDAIALKAQAALRLKDYRTAAELAGAVIGVGDDERRVGPLFIAGAASLFEGAPQQAREYLSRYLAQRPDDASARRLLGQALLQLGDAGPAYEVLQPLAGAAEDDAQLLSRLAMAAAGAGAVNDAVGYLARALELEPDNHRLTAQLAAIKVATEDRQLGLRQLDELSAQDDGYALLALDTAINRLAQRELDAAVETARRVQKMAPKALEPVLVQGIALLRDGQLDAAQAAFSKVLERQPDDIAARTGMAEIRLRRGNLEQALAEFGELAADYPEDVTLRLNFAAAQVQAGRSLKAQQSLEQIVAENPESSPARIALAELYIGGGRPGPALEVLRDAADQSDPELLVASARALLMAERPAAAVETLERALARRPASVPARLALAEAYKRNGQPDAADQALAAAMKLAPKRRDVQFARLQHLLTKPQLVDAILDQAVDDAVRFADERPDDARSAVVRALVLYRAEARREEALRALRDLYAGSRSPDLALLLAKLYSAAGRAEDAAALLAPYVSAHPEDIHAQLTLARAQLAAGDYAAAADNLVSGMERGAQGAGLPLVTAWTLAQAERPREAERYLSQAEASGADGTLVPYTRGLIALESGDANGAVTALRQAMDAAGDSPSPRLRLDLARTLMAAGDLTRARQVLQELTPETLSKAEGAALDSLRARLM